MLTRIRDDERGMAMILALGVTFVVMMLAAVVFAEAIHNSTASAYDRKRVQSVDAAEAGLDYFYNALEHTQASSLTSIPVTGAAPCPGGQMTARASARPSMIQPYPAAPLRWWANVYRGCGDSGWARRGENPCCLTK